VKRSADLVVVGAGVVGLALADRWLEVNPSDSVLVLEKENDLGLHASGRNSGVLHAGFYYAPDTLKAQLTRDGNKMLREFCAETGVRVKNTGKVVVTTSADQLPALATLYARGAANGVELERIDESQLYELEPLARTVGAALWSPTTGVADPVEVVIALGKRVRDRGGEILLGAQVVAAKPGLVTLKNGEQISAGHLINAAGLYADTVAHWFGVGMDYRMLPFKGLYWYGNWPADRLKRHIYPVPDPRNPFLGVHLTVTVNGRAKIGPTAIPSLWREDYGVVSGFSAKEFGGVARSFPRFLASKEHDVLGLIRTELPKYSQKYLVNQAKALAPSVLPRDFKEKGRPGVRAQLLHVPTGKLEMDFVVETGVQSTHVLNAVSPAWTSSLAFAKYVVSGISDISDISGTSG
jgi:L-2-hydroxyglutarate oxidase LhgO